MLTWFIEITLFFGANYFVWDRLVNIYIYIVWHKSRVGSELNVQFLRVRYLRIHNIYYVIYIYYVYVDA